ncbi:ATP-binding protein [Paracoccus sp. PAR01]|uniref:ATP-binding protein n=1 Tax=Paracoccus sp. PAR01 TaxID=2769282 RepID=UPI0017854A5E|nr:ATP-binding protein [Paracoccus sp. PAR01]MBD9527609.1 histidine kinase [Paracoccus sp. PAR01]
MDKSVAEAGADLRGGVPLPAARAAFPGFEPEERSYQSWVADETIEDYALRYAPVNHRRWNPFTIANTALGGISFLALEAIGAALTLSWGVHTTVIAVLLVSVFIFVTSLPIAYHAARSNVDMDLLTRGAGFGYIGSSITSLIYATYTIIFFALEGVIIAQALSVSTGLPLPVGYLLSTLVILPFAVRGMTAISRFQMVTQIPWIVLGLMPFAAIAILEPQEMRSWLDATGPTLGWLSLGGAIGVLCALTLQIGEQVDYLRFLPPKETTPALRWWSALILAGPGWILIGGTKVLMGSFLVTLALGDGMAADFALEPIGMFWQAYQHLFSPAVALAVATVYILLAQIKINVTNAYAGSLAQSNFFLRVTRYHPGRLVWLIFHITVSCALMLMGVFSTLEAVLAIYANLALAWLGTIFADLVILKPLGRSPKRIEFKRAYLPDFNPVGCSGIVVGGVIGIGLLLGLGGPMLQAWAPPIAFVVAMLTASAVGIVKGKSVYFAREPHDFGPIERCDCAICSHGYEIRDMAYCTFYERPICSLCCSLEPHCRDFCKRPRLAPSIPVTPDGLRLHRVSPRIWQRIWQIAAVFAALLAGLAGFYLVARHLSSLLEDRQLVTHFFLGSVPMLALLAIWVVMANERKRLTEDDLLGALTRLGQAQRELALNQRLAAVGEVAATISHELRNPLGTITSSVEVLSRHPGLGPEVTEDVDRIRRNIRRCRRIIDILLDFARQGATEIVPIDLPAWLNAVVADHSGQRFVRMQIPAGMRLKCDPSRLQFAVHNLIDNALHAAEAAGRSPCITLSARRRGSVTEIEVADNGPGIRTDLQARIFDPLFSTRDTGVGLGLPLVRRVAQLHGGEAWIARSSPDGTAMCLSIRDRS